jgi:glycine/D-amino acid oxidase-like deaminating enzyme
MSAPSGGERVLWREQVEPPVATGGPLPRSADVVVIGAGYAGLSAARVLAGAGRDVVVLEKEELGWGAHARNGGMVIPELKAGPATLRAKYGELGVRLHREVHEAFDFVEGLVSGPDGIACDYERSGQLYLAHTPRLVPHLRKLAAEHADDFGEPVRFVGAADLGGEIGSEAFHGAVLYDRTGSLHPARFHAGLADLAQRNGARVHDRSPVTSLEQTATGPRVGTVGGTIDAGHVVLATNAYADDLVPELQRRVLPIGSYIVATEPLAPEVAASISPHRRMFVDTKNLLFYWRLTPDGRLLFGGRRSLAAATLDDAGRYLESAARRIHPQLGDAAFTHRWGGKVAITFDRMPHAGRVRGAWYVSGCNGSGVALNTWLGHRVGEVLLGRAAPPAVADLRFPTIPLHRWRRAYLPVVGSWFRWQDRA